MDTAALKAHLRSQARATAQSLRRSPGTSGLLAILIVLCASGLVGGDPVRDKLSLLVGNTILHHWYIWNVATAGLFEAAPLKLACVLPLVVWLGTRLEASWSAATGGSGGAKRLARFVGAVNVATGAASLLCAVLGYAFAGSGDGEKTAYLYDAERNAAYGPMGVVVALAVALTQEQGSRAAFQRVDAGADGDGDAGAGASFLRVRHVPLALLLLHTAPAVFLAQTAPMAVAMRRDLQFAWLGAGAAFAYLRFYERAWVAPPAEGTVAREDWAAFRASVFFPGPLKPLVGVVSTLAVALCKRAGVCRRVTAADGAGAFVLPTTGGDYSGARGVHRPASGISDAINRALVKKFTSPGGGAGAGARRPADAVSERRRQRALRALDAKLAQIAAQSAEVKLDGPTGLGQSHPLEAEVALLASGKKTLDVAPRG